MKVLPMAPSNQRRDERLDAAIPVVLIRGRTEIPLVTSDVSYRGLFVAAPTTSPVRALVKLRVELPAGGFTAHAMVVHVPEEGRVGMGLQFWALNGEDRKTWEEFVRGVLQAKRASVQIVTPAAPFSVGPDSAVSGIRRLGEAGATPASQGSRCDRDCERTGRG